MKPHYHISFTQDNHGQLLPLPSVPHPNTQAVSKTTSFTRIVFYDDQRGRRVLYELDPDHDQFRYVVECSNTNQTTTSPERLSFPTLKQALYALASSVLRNE